MQLIQKMDIGLVIYRQGSFYYYIEDHNFDPDPEQDPKDPGDNVLDPQFQIQIRWIRVSIVNGSSFLTMYAQL